jgi:septal ring factor EnvC (AmiA/AmiB activator)
LRLPPKPNAIIDLEKAVVILQVRADATVEALQGIRRDLGDLEKNAEGAKSQIHQLDTQIARIEEALKHNAEKLDKFAPTDRLIRVEEGLKNVERELDKLRSSRFEIGKLFLAAFLGGGIAFGLNVLLDTIKAARTDRQTQTTKP